MSVEGKIAFVAGGGRGIGRATAIALARAGAHVAIGSRTQHELDEVASTLNKYGSQASAFKMDVANESDVTNAVSELIDTHGRIDIMVNAAGVLSPIGPTWEVDSQEWQRTLQINVTGLFFLCKAVLPSMIKSKQGKIICFSGGGATSAFPRFSAYSASKSAVVRLAETLAEEVKEFNIQVNAVAPGMVNTGMQESVLAAGEKAGEQYRRVKDALENDLEDKTMVSPDLTAELVVFLASVSSGKLSGKLISAPHDNWKSWNADDLDKMMSSDWLNLRRFDKFTVDHNIEGLVEQ
jgi:NAD(P)-dependent dehydrogenase (short-subunit alcohol dehydrogenase family)